MKNELNTRDILNVYEKIKQHGSSKEGQHQLDGITAYTDHDGYTVYLEGYRTALQTGFHNTYRLDYENSRDAEQFIKALKSIDANHD